ncbi:MAG TPA: DUF4397 domain-containing protein [Ferruginibacter sp.]|nr:DUF4397 domain-containing protein [Ferruginibacter sp.]
MKLNKLITLLIIVVAFSFAFISCKREAPLTASIETGINTKATVQVYNATVKSTRNFLYVDGNKISGSTFAFGNVFPATAYAFKVDAGSRTFLIKDTLGSTTQPPLTFAETMDAGKSYTIFTYDTLNSIKQVTVSNDIEIPSDTTSRLRFANFIFNTTPVPAVDVYSSVFGNTKVFTNVATASVTGFIPYPSGKRDTLSVYATGTTSPLIIRLISTGVTPTRSYTTVYSGSYRATKSFALFNTY